MGLVSAGCSGFRVLVGQAVVRGVGHPATTIMTEADEPLLPVALLLIVPSAIVPGVLVGGHLGDRQRVLLFASLAAQGCKSAGVLSHRETASKVRDLEALPVAAVGGPDGVV